VSKSFTLVEVLLALTLLSFVALVVLEGGTNSKRLMSSTKERTAFYDELSLILLNSLDNESDEVKLLDHLSSFELSDQMRGYFKDREFSYTKEVANQEEFVLLKAVRLHNDTAGATIYTFELAQ
jgi:competence protein ComGF